MWRGPMKTKKTLKKRLRGKVEAYDALCAINHGFEVVVANLEKLLTLDVFHRRVQRKFIESCRLAIEETRAWANFEITEVLNSGEERDWIRLGRLRDTLAEGDRPSKIRVETDRKKVGK